MAILSEKKASSKAAQFRLERVLRARILSSAEKDRSAVVDQAYKELFRSFPDHPRLTKTEEDAARDGRMKARLIEPLLQSESRILEIGCGTGDVVASLVQQGYACTGVEISQDMQELCKKRGLDVVRGTASCVDLPDECFDVIFSQEVVEHLHPDEVHGHFREAFRLLKPNGILITETPNRRTGPQDVSRGFTRVAEGLHLKEWSVRELIGLFQDAGFVKVRGLLAAQFLARRSERIHRLTRVPAVVKYLQDLLLALVPTLRFRTFVGKSLGLDDIFLYARKPGRNQ